jgi:ankyrin repeat protein
MGQNIVKYLINSPPVENETNNIYNNNNFESTNIQEKCYLTYIPEDIIKEIMNYVTSLDDQASFMTTCKYFNEIGWKYFIFDIEISWSYPSKIHQYKTCRMNRLFLEKLLSKNKHFDPSQEKDDNVLLDIASAEGHHRVVELLLKDPRIDPSSSFANPIVEAAQNNHYLTVEILLKDPRVDPSYPKNLAISWAVENRNTKIIELLTKDPRVDSSIINTHNSEAFWEAIRYGWYYRNN